MVRLASYPLKSTGLKNSNRLSIFVEKLESRDVPSNAAQQLGGVIVTYPADPNSLNSVPVHTWTPATGTPGTPIRTLPRERYAVASGAGQTTIVNVYDSYTNALIGTLTPFGQNYTGGVSVAVGDVNGDGVPDIIVGAGAGSQSWVEVFDGSSLNQIKSFMAYEPTFTGGVNVAVGDINHDGRADIVTAAAWGGGPHIEVFSGKDLFPTSGVGKVAPQSFWAYDPNFRGGVNIAVADLDGDGYADIITGAGIGGGPHVEAFSGKNFNLITSYFAFNPTFTGGVSVAAGDLNGDGHVEIITAPMSGASAQINVFNLETSTTMNSFTAFNGSYSHGASITVKDLNGDGKSEIIVTSGPGSAPIVDVYSGLGTLERSFPSMMPYYTGGLFVG